MKICYNCFCSIPDSVRVCPRCGSSTELGNGELFLHALPCGAALNGKYIVGRILGQGGFGITYAGQDFQTKELVAIKEYYPDAMASRINSYSVVPSNTGRREEFEYGKKQFLEEARTLAAFIGSPNIVRVYSYFEENGTAYFVMEYVEGKNLRQFITDRGGRISWEETWDLLMPVLDALSEVHYRNIIHRDIKPDNIITKNGSAKLIDFGAARYSHGEKSKSLRAVLTPGYAPPEQYYSSGDQGAWTDVYALAATIYFCITGNVPIESVERLVKDTLRKPSELGISIPEYAETALMKALAVKEQNRFKSTYDFRNTVLEGKRLEELKSTGTDRRRSVTDSSHGKGPEVITKDETKDGPKAQLTSEPATQKKESAGRLNRILLAVAIIALIVVAGFVWSNGGSSLISGTGTGGTDQTDIDSKEIGRQDEPVELTDTWDEIIAAGNDGTYKEKYRIGDTKELDMGSEGIITMRLAAIDEDELADGSGKAPMTWVADELLQSTHTMNSEKTNEGGWEASEMRIWLRETVLPLMPEEVRNNVREVTKYSYSMDEYKEVISKDTIWIPSAREVYFSDQRDMVEKYYETAGVSYTRVFGNNESRIRSREREHGPNSWWLRSAYVINSVSGCFSSVAIGGNSIRHPAPSECGVVIGFCL